MRPLFRICVCAMIGLSLIGCGSGHKPSPPMQQTEAQLSMKNVDDLKNRLKILSETGNTGTSVVAGMDDVIKSLPADKSASLMKDWEDMKKAGRDSATVKSIAKRMMDKL